MSTFVRSKGLLALLGYVALIAATFVWPAQTYTVVSEAKAIYHQCVPDPFTIRKYLAQHPVRRLQIGAGINDASGWLNSDIDPSRNQIYLDATARFPLPDESFDAVFSEHLIEHLSYPGATAMLRESFRILRKGGRIRIVTPDLKRFVSLVTDPSRPEGQRLIELKIANHGWPRVPQPGVYVLNQQMREFGHQYLFDSLSLRALLEECGFRDVEEFAPGISRYPAFLEAEGRPHWPAPWREMNELEAFAMEAMKP